MRVVQRAVAAIVFTVVLLGAPSAAFAHAVVKSSTPDDGARLTSAPTEVQIRFTEPVSIDLGGLKVVDNKGQRVDTGEPLKMSDTAAIGARLNAGLGDGTYVASYRVVSEDGHPISGAITFGVGDSPTTVDASTLPGAGDRTSEVLGWVARLLTYSSAFLAAGLAFFVWFLFDGGAERKPLSRISFVATGVAVIGALGQITVQASLATGRGLGVITDGSVWAPVLGNNLGWAMGILVLGLAGAGASMLVREDVVGQTLSFYSLLAVAASFALWGHTAEGSLPGLKIAFDAIHVFAGATWFGGLVALGVVLSSRRVTLNETATELSTDESDGALQEDANTDDESVPEAGSPASTAFVISRFSTAAAFTVLALTISGLVLAWQELGSVSALWSTGYGQALLIKVGLVVVIVALAAYNRFRLVPDTVAAQASHAGDDPSASPTRKLLATVRVEAIGLVVVLAVTGVLVNTVPGRTGSVTGPFSQTASYGANQVSTGVTPAQAGPNQVHITFLNPSGQPFAAARTVQVEFSHPQAGVGPITREMVPAGTGHFVLDTTDLSIPGTWQVVFIARLSDFDQQRLTFQVPVGG